eukprot:Opistho-2@75176
MALCFLRDAILALSVLHAGGFVHRDLKLGCMMFDWELVRWRLVDFDLAVRVDERGAAGGSVGTKEYMAPETQRKNGHTTAASDLYCLGLTAGMMYAHASAVPDEEHDAWRVFIDTVVCMQACDPVKRGTTAEHLAKVKAELRRQTGNEDAPSLPLSMQWCAGERREERLQEQERALCV